MSDPNPNDPRTARPRDPAVNDPYVIRQPAPAEVRRPQGASNAMWGWIAGGVMLALLLVFLFSTNTADRTATVPPAATTGMSPERSAAPPPAAGSASPARQTPAAQAPAAQPPARTPAPAQTPAPTPAPPAQR